MKTVTEQKVKLEQKKNRLAAEQTRLNLKERKMRTRHLIEVGGLVVKAELDHLPTNTLYGALLSLKNTLAENDSILKQWSSLGKTVLDKDEKSKVAIILKLAEMPSSEIRTHLRTHGLRWNRLREEWYGYVASINSLKEGITSIKHQLEIIK
jgi:hypothetical protein